MTALENLRGDPKLLPIQVRLANPHARGRKYSSGWRHWLRL